VPAVYFVEPTADNIRRICNDFSAKLYDSVAINFLSAVPRALLEELAAAAVKADMASSIIKVMRPLILSCLSFLCVRTGVRPVPQLHFTGAPAVYAALPGRVPGAQLKRIGCRN